MRLGSGETIKEKNGKRKTLKGVKDEPLIEQARLLATTSSSDWSF